MFKDIKPYFKRIYKARFFLEHLIKWDIKFRFRGSKIGIFWTVLQPLLLTFIISGVFGFVFKQPMREYSPYILSGLLVWDVINNAIVGNSYSFLSAETYIRQYSHPIIIYPMRAAAVSISMFLIAFSAFLVWICLLRPQNLPIALLSFPLTVMIYFIFCWALSTISSHLHIRFRDYPFIMGLVMQILWYFSPVFFKEEMFSSNAALYTVFRLNPITQALELVRKPFFYGRLPDLGTYLYIFLLLIIVVTIAWNVNKKCERNVIFYF